MRTSFINAKILGPIGIALHAMTSPQRVFALCLIPPSIIADETFFRKLLCSAFVRKYFVYDTSHVPKVAAEWLLIGNGITNQGGLRHETTKPPTPETNDARRATRRTVRFAGARSAPFAAAGSASTL
jgi:hypothetical protein